MNTKCTDFTRVAETQGNDVSPRFTIVEGHCVVQTFNTMHRKQANASLWLPPVHLCVLSSQMVHLPFCAFPWPSCSEATDASFVCGIIVLLPIRGGADISSKQLPSFKTPINHRLHCRICYRQFGAIGSISQWQWFSLVPVQCCRGKPLLRFA